MPPQAQNYVIVLIASAIVNLALAVYSWRSREVKGANALAVLLLLVAEWTFIGALKWATNDLQREIFLTRLGFIGGTTSVVAIFIVILTYLNRDKFLTRRNIALLYFIPVSTIILVWTNDHHHLIWTSAELKYVQDGIANLDPSYSLFYWLQITYAYSLMVIGVGLLIAAYSKSSTLYRKQIATLLLGVIAPWILHVLHLFTGIDLTHLSLSITGITMMWNLFQHQLFDIVPIAQDIVVEGLEDGIITLNTAGIITDVNPSAQKLIGKSLEHILEQPLRKVFPQGHILGDSVPGQREITLRGKNGKKHYDVKISPIHGEENYTLGEVLVMRDITARKEMEEKIAQARDEAVAASNTKTYLLNNVTNDIQEPLNTILGHTESLETRTESGINPKQKDILKNMHESAEQLLNFINKLVHQAQLETGRLKLHYDRIRTATLITEIQNIARPLLQNKPIDFITTASPGMPENLKGDLYWLKQIIANLVSNAAKYTEKGKIEVTLQLEEEDFWSLSVSDTGRGIPKEAQEKIFEPFQRDETSLVRAQDSGAGLGLAIVQQLTTLMGGEITLESALKQGSTFTISLPFEPQDGAL